MEYHNNGPGVVRASGTPGYMAPDAIVNKPQIFCVDDFVLGVIVNELLMEERPYQGQNRKEIKEQMFTLEIKLDNDDMSEDWKDDNILDFINKLLKRKKIKRMGSKGCREIKTIYDLKMSNGNKWKISHLILPLFLIVKIISMIVMLKNKTMILFMKVKKKYISLK